MTTIELTHQGGFAVSFAYHPERVAAIKAIPGRKYDPQTHTWQIPATADAARGLLAFIRADQTDLSPPVAERLDALIGAAEAARLASRATDAAIAVPVPEGLSYLPYQKAGISYALQRDNVLIADEMGLGKTIQAIGISNAEPDVQTVLVICPASLKVNWQREWTRWDVKGLPVGIANGQFPDTAVVVVNYDILKKHRVALRARPWDLLIIDEAHLLKNPKAQRTQEVFGRWHKEAAKRLPAIAARRRVCLTGTPIVNRPAEAWTLVHALAPAVFPAWRTFMTRYAAAYQTRWGWDVSGASHLDELQTKLRESLMIRRLKADVLTELPAKRRQIIELPANGAAGVIGAEQAALTAIETRLAALRVRVELAKAAETAIEFDQAMDALHEGRRSAFTELSRLRHATARAKVPYVIEHLREALDGGKVLCFAYHQDVIADLAEAFPDTCVTVTGETPLAARQAAVDRFQTDPACQLFIGNLIAAGVGLTLTASSHVVFAELDWVPGVMSQAEDRAHRIGQRNSVLIQHLVLEGSLDATMARTLIQKQAILDQALDEGGVPLPLVEPDLFTPLPASTQGVTRKRLAAEAVQITAEQIAAVHEALRTLASYCDGAQALDGMGFNKLDAAIGKSLAAAATLTPRQAALGRTIARKYRRQLSAAVLERMTARDEPLPRCSG